MFPENKTGRAGTPAPEHKLLPIVRRMCRQVDEIFVRYVGPIGPELSQEALQKWVALGNTGPSHVPRYIHLLSQNLLNEEQRVPFFHEARDAIRELLTGK